MVGVRRVGADRIADCSVSGKYAHGSALRTLHMGVASGSMAAPSTSGRAHYLGLLVHAGAINGARVLKADS